MALSSDAGLNAEKAVNSGSVVDLEERQEDVAPTEFIA